MNTRAFNRWRDVHGIGENIRAMIMIDNNNFIRL